MASGNMGGPDLDRHLRTKLKKYASQGGLTYSELGKKCGIRWNRTLAEIKNIRSTRARAREIKDFVYDLWNRGLVIIDPPKGRQKSPRVWDPGAVLCFSRVKGRGKSSASHEYPNDHARLLATYDQLAGKVLSGHVLVYQVRRALGWWREKFDRAVKELNERPVPEIELHWGDAQNYKDDERAGSFERRGVLYLLMRWRTA